MKRTVLLPVSRRAVREADLFLADLLGSPLPQHRNRAWGGLAEDEPSPAALAVTERLALLTTTKAPLPVVVVKKDGTRDDREVRRAARDGGVASDYKAVCAVVPSPPQPRLLLYFHGNDGYVTLRPSSSSPQGAASRLPRWAGPRADAVQSPSAALRYKFTELAARQQALTHGALSNEPVKDAVVLLPEDAQAEETGPWAVPPRGQYGSKSTDRARLEELVSECYELLRGLARPSGSGPYLPPAERASWASNVARFFLCGHSGGGKPLGEASQSTLARIGPSSVMGVRGRAAELWLFDCTYGFPHDGYRTFCRTWKEAGKLARQPDGARFVCIFRPKSDTAKDAEQLMGEIAKELDVPAKTLLKTHLSSKLDDPSVEKDVIPALLSQPVVFISTLVAHDAIPTVFTPLLLRTAAS